eukprot:2905384-Alexandrium_andersonii.AAC.1
MTHIACGLRHDAPPCVNVCSTSALERAASSVRQCAAAPMRSNERQVAPAPHYACGCVATACGVARAAFLIREHNARRAIRASVCAA